MESEKRTRQAYGFLWDKNKTKSSPERWHFNNMQEAISEPIVRGATGIDIGSGCGWDTYIMAKNNPSVIIFSIDISDGVYKTKEIASGLNNVKIIKGSLLDIPMKDNVFDFVYSFGVLHHASNPQKGLLEIVRILKKNAPAFLYIYEDHSENTIKYMAVKLIAGLRNITVKLNPAFLYVLCGVVSPFIYLIFSFPARFLKKFKTTEKFASSMPFNFGSGFFSLRSDIYDRFSAPVESRFSREEACNLFRKSGFSRININRLNGSAGWVIRGYKE